MNQDYDLCARIFNDVLEANDFIKHFEYTENDFTDHELFSKDFKYVLFGYKPKYIVTDGSVLVNMGL